jgi:hypothetical protein
MDARSWIGLAAIAISAGAFLHKLARVLLGAEPRSALIAESLHDAALICVGTALLAGRDAAASKVLLVGSTLAFFGYVGRKIRVWRLACRAANPGGTTSAE